MEFVSQALIVGVVVSYLIGRRLTDRMRRLALAVVRVRPRATTSTRHRQG